MNSAPRTPARRLSALSFPIAAALVYAILFTMIARVPAASRPGPLGLGILADLLVTVPALWYLLVVRGRGVAAQSLVPVVLASLVLARFALPPAIRPSRAGLEILFGVAELAVIVLLVVGTTRAMRAARAAGDLEPGAGALPERLAAIGRRVLGMPWLAEIFAFEIATLAYAFGGWRMKSPDDPRAFTMHRESGWAMAAVGLGMLIIVEGFPVHVLVSHVNPVLAWVFTASSAYALIWLVGDSQALRLRPTRVTDEGLWVRLGLRVSARVAWSDLREVRLPASDQDRGRRARATLRAVTIGEPGLILELARPLAARGFYGFPKTVERVAIAPDDRRAFVAAIAAHAPDALAESAARLLDPGSPAGARRA